MLKQIILVDHQKHWRQDFEDEKRLLQSIFDPDEYIQINHIGSTAVPSIKAKPIVDINIAFHKLDTKEYYTLKLTSSKYVYANGFTSEKWILFQKEYDGKCFNLHLLDKEAKRYEEQLIFKDMLIKNIKFAQDYERLKIHASKDDPRFYYMNKGPFVKSFFKGYWQGYNEALQLNSKFV